MTRAEIKRLIELLRKFADRKSATTRERQLIRGIIFCAQWYGRRKLEMDYNIPDPFLRAIYKGKLTRPKRHTDGDVLRAWLHRYDDIEGIILNHEDGRKQRIRR